MIDSTSRELLPGHGQLEHLDDERVGLFEAKTATKPGEGWRGGRSATPAVVVFFEQNA